MARNDHFEHGANEHRVLYTSESNPATQEKPSERLHAFLHSSHSDTDAAMHGLSGASLAEAHDLGRRWHKAASKFQKMEGFDPRGVTGQHCEACGKDWTSSPGKIKSLFDRTYSGHDDHGDYDGPL